MNRKWPLAATIFALVAVAAAISFDVNNPVLNGHIDKLKGAGTFSAVFTVNRIGGDVEDHKLILSKPGLLRWDSPSMLVIANGTSILTLDKKANSYTEEPQTTDAMRKLLSNDVLWTWSAFADDMFLKPITDARAGASRKVKGVAVKELNVYRKEKLMTMFIDDQTGFARGVTFQEDKGGQKTTTLIVASEALIGKDMMASSDKQFTLPSGAQKVERLAVAVTWKDVQPIFAARCGCHINNAPSGLSLASYNATIKGSRGGSVIVAGDPDASILLQCIVGKRAPKMPPQGSLSQQQIDTLNAWIKDGAKQ